MTGNVREWCRDVWRRYRSQVPEPDPVEKPEEGEKPLYVIRGGSFATPTETARVTWRAHSEGMEYRAPDDKAFVDVGFRVVLEVLTGPASLPSGVATATSRVPEPQP
jgi:formylglycine-generating enzyme required for sulfatase activity